MKRSLLFIHSKFAILLQRKKILQQPSLFNNHDNYARTNKSQWINDCIPIHPYLYLVDLMENILQQPSPFNNLHIHVSTATSNNSYTNLHSHSDSLISNGGSQLSENNFGTLVEVSV